MKITIQMICEELSADVEKTFIHSSRNAAKVERVLLFEPNLETEDNKVYLVKRQEIDILTAEKRDGAFLVLLGGQKIMRCV